MKVTWDLLKSNPNEKFGSWVKQFNSWKSDKIATSQKKHSARCLHCLVGDFCAHAYIFKICILMKDEKWSIEWKKQANKKMQDQHMVGNWRFFSSLFSLRKPNLKHWKQRINESFRNVNQKWNWHLEKIDVSRSHICTQLKL